MAISLCNAGRCVMVKPLARSARRRCCAGPPVFLLDPGDRQESFCAFHGLILLRVWRVCVATEATTKNHRRKWRWFFVEKSAFNVFLTGFAPLAYQPTARRAANGDRHRKPFISRFSISSGQPSSGYSQLHPVQVSPSEASSSALRFHASVTATAIDLIRFATADRVCHSSKVKVSSIGSKFRPYSSA